MADDLKFKNNFIILKVNLLGNLQTSLKHFQNKTQNNAKSKHK